MVWKEKSKNLKKTGRIELTFNKNATNSLFLVLDDQKNAKRFMLVY